MPARKTKLAKETAKKSKSPEDDFMDKAQPAVNIGLIGHVDHGKTTLTEKLSGKWTDTHSEEIKRGITIRLGYADAVFRKCPKCEGPEGFTTQKKCAIHHVETLPLRKVSFIDAPGHESLMATMLCGANIMDGALLLVAANEQCPQPQTREHLMALEMIGIKNVIVVQNKIDLVTSEDALKNYNQIKEFLKNTSYKDAPIIPISAQHNVNINFLIKAIEDEIQTPDRDLTQDPIMFVARSFDINKPGTKPGKIVGGVLGGSLLQGKFAVGDEIEIKPGRKIEREGKTNWLPIITKITDLKTGGNSVEKVVPGGSIGVLTNLDPSIVKSDSLTGAVVGHKGKLPKIWNDLYLEVHLLERIVGSKDDLNVDPIKMSEMLMLNVNAAATVGIVDNMGKGLTHCNLKLPVCADAGSRVTISRKVGTRWRLIGYGIIKEK